MNLEDYIQVFIHTRSKFEWQRITRQLVSLKENSDKIKFVLNILEKDNYLGDYKSFESKSNDKSVDYRKQGNIYFSLLNKDYSHALQLYNKSICYAESNTECLAIGYANRSAIYYEWKMYTKCLENIELAFNSCDSLSDKLREKWLNRKKLCLDNISMGNEIDETLDEGDPVELTYPAHPTVPFIADCLVMDCKDDYGQYIKTTRDLYPGDCIAIERPLFARLLTQTVYNRCAHCWTENNFSLIPCPNCTATMYCSKTCLTTAYKNYHCFECSAINELTTLFPNVHLAALTVVLKLFSNDNYLNKTLTYLNDFRPMTVYDFDYTNSFDYADEYKLLHNFGRNKSISTHELFCVAAHAATLYKLVKTNKYLKEIILKSTLGRNYENLFLNLLYHSLTNIELHPLGRVDMQFSLNSSIYGSAIYPFTPLINHSCAPNVMNIFYGRLRHSVLFVSRKIASGEQLFYNYGGIHYVFMSRQIRQKRLEEKFNIKCICDACQLDYPMYFNLKMHPNLPHIITDRVTMELCGCSRQYARTLLKIIVGYLTKYDKFKFYPTMQLVDAEGALKWCLTILLN